MWYLKQYKLVLFITLCVFAIMTKKESPWHIDMSNPTLRDSTDNNF